MKYQIVIATKINDHNRPALFFRDGILRIKIWMARKKNAMKSNCNFRCVYWVLILSHELFILFYIIQMINFHLLFTQNDFVIFISRLIFFPIFSDRCTLFWIDVTQRLIDHSWDFLQNENVKVNNITEIKKHRININWLFVGAQSTRKNAKQSRPDKLMLGQSRGYVLFSPL